MDNFVYVRFKLYNTARGLRHADPLPILFRKHALTSGVYVCARCRARRAAGSPWS